MLIRETNIREGIKELGFKITDTYKSPFTGVELHEYECTPETPWVNTGTSYLIIEQDTSIILITQSYGSYDTQRYSMEFFIDTIEELKMILKAVGFEG